MRIEMDYVLRYAKLPRGRSLRNSHRTLGSVCIASVHPVLDPQSILIVTRKFREVVSTSREHVRLFSPASLHLQIHKVSARPAWVAERVKLAQLERYCLSGT